MLSILAEAVSITIPTPDLAAVPAWGWATGGGVVWYALMAVMFRRSWSERLIRYETDGARGAGDATGGDRAAVFLYYLLSPAFITIIGLGKAVSNMLIKSPPKPSPDKEAKA